MLLQSRRRGARPGPPRPLCPTPPGSSPISGSPHPSYGLDCAKESGSPSPPVSTPPYSARPPAKARWNGVWPLQAVCVTEKERPKCPRPPVERPRCTVPNSGYWLLEWEQRKNSPRPVLLDVLLVPSLTDVTIFLSGPGLGQRGHPGSSHVLSGLGSFSVGDQAPLCPASRVTPFSPTLYLPYSLGSGLLLRVAGVLPGVASCSRGARVPRCLASWVTSPFMSYF